MTLSYPFRPEVGTQEGTLFFVSLDQIFPLISEEVSREGYDGWVLVTEERVAQVALPRLSNGNEGNGALASIVLPEGEGCKTFEEVSRLCQRFLSLGLTRHSLVVALGGGALTDLVGFVASIYKRGVPFISIPTTLIGAIDAAIGGKTAINVGGVKNSVGSFYPAQKVLISTAFLETLSSRELLSGYGEVLKYACLSGGALFKQVLSVPLSSSFFVSPQGFEVLSRCVAFKQEVVSQDPFDIGLRASLNLGHTIGHALESYLPLLGGGTVPHGIAVAAGLVMALYLSHLCLGFPSHHLMSLSTYIRDYFPRLAFSCEDYPKLLDLIRQDKKNGAGEIRMVLLRELGEVELGVSLSEDQICGAFDFYRDFMGV